MALKKVGPNRYRVTVSVRDKERGFPVTKQATVVGTLPEAKLVESNLYKELRARSLTMESASTFAQAVDVYVRNRRERGRMSRSHEGMVRYVGKELGHVRLEVFADRFGAYRKHLMRSLTAHGKPRVRRMTPEERLRLMAAIGMRRPYIAPIIGYMLAVPCRVGELVGAKREQYNPFTNTVYIPTSKAGIPIHKPVPADMAAYFRGIPADCPWLFYREVEGRYQPITRQVLRRAWRDCLGAAGLSDYRLHDLRHEAATDLYIRGNSERIIMSAAGWKTPMLSRYWNLGGLESAQKVVFSAQIPVDGLADVAQVR